MDKKYNMIDNVAGTLATAAGYKFVKKFLRNYLFLEGNLVYIGADLISAYAGMWIGGKVRDKTRSIRVAVQNMNDNGHSDPNKTPKYTYETEHSPEDIAKQAKDMVDWMASVQ